MNPKTCLSWVCLPLFLFGLTSCQDQPEKKGKIDIGLSGGAAPPDPIFLVLEIPCGDHMTWKSGDGLKYDVVIRGAPADPPSECQVFIVNRGQRMQLPRRDTTLTNTDSVRIECIGHGEGKCRVVIKEVVRTGYKGPRKPDGRIDLDKRHWLEVKNVRLNCGQERRVSSTAGYDVTIVATSEGCPARIWVTDEHGNEKRIEPDNREIVTVHRPQRNILVRCGTVPDAGKCAFRVMAIQSTKP